VEQIQTLVALHWDSDCSGLGCYLDETGTTLKQSGTEWFGTLQKIVTKVIFPRSDEVGGCNKALPRFWRPDGRKLDRQAGA
jgi:hypothetical protein